VRIDLVANLMVSSNRFLGLAGQAENEVPWMTMPSSWQSLVKRRATSTRMPFLMLCDLLIAGFIADQQET